MILSLSTIRDLRKKSGLCFERANDFDILSSIIGKETKRHIGITTLKRLFGYIKDERSANEYTLNTLALYLGFETWEAYVKVRHCDSVYNFIDDALYIHKLTIGDIVDVKYLDREVRFSVVDFKGQNALKVENTHNGSLMKDDILLLYKLCKGEIIQAEQLIRGNSIGNYKTHGEISSINITHSLI